MAGNDQYSTKNLSIAIETAKYNSLNRRISSKIRRRYRQMTLYKQVPGVGGFAAVSWNRGSCEVNMQNISQRPFVAKTCVGDIARFMGSTL
jgi:hypothetical protein